MSSRMAWTISSWSSVREKSMRGPFVRGGGGVVVRSDERGGHAPVERGALREDLAGLGQHPRVVQEAVQDAVDDVQAVLDAVRGEQCGEGSAVVEQGVERA